MGLDNIDDNKVIDPMEQGKQLMTDRPRLHDPDVLRKFRILKGIDEMDAETVVPEQKITDPEYENLQGRRRNASPGLIIRFRYHLNVF